MITKTHDPHFVFKPRFGAGGWCDLRIYANSATQDVTVITTEPIGIEGEYLNDGLSVINGIDYIAIALQQRGVKWTHWIDYLPARAIPNPALHAIMQRRGQVIKYREPDEIEFVVFADNHAPSWRPLPYEFMEHVETYLLGESFPYWHETQGHSKYEAWRRTPQK